MCDPINACGKRRGADDAVAAGVLAPHILHAEHGCIVRGRDTGQLLEHRRLAVDKIIGENDVMDADKLPKVKMPNRNGFVSKYPERN